jgi:hypothetical protein
VQMTAGRWIGTWALAGLAVSLFWLIAASVFELTWGWWTVFSWPASLLTMANSGELLTVRTLPSELLAGALNALLYAAVGGLLWFGRGLAAARVRTRRQ